METLKNLKIIKQLKTEVIEKKINTDANNIRGTIKNFIKRKTKINFIKCKC